MMSTKRYYIVEFRLPVEVTEAPSVEEAARKARASLERETGINVSNWFVRVFEYGEGNDHVGPVAEYFANPTGTTFREVTQNVTKHEQLIKESESDEG